MTDLARRDLPRNGAALAAAGAFVLAALAMPAGDARAVDDAKYPDWTGQWERFVVSGFPASLHSTRPSPGDPVSRPP